MKSRDRKETGSSTGPSPSWLEAQPGRRRYVRRALWTGLISALIIGGLFSIYASYAVRAARRSMVRQLEQQSLTLLEALASSAAYATDLSGRAQVLKREALVDKTGLVRRALRHSRMQVPQLKELQSLVLGGGLDGVLFIPIDKPPVGYPNELSSRCVAELWEPGSFGVPDDVTESIIMTLPATEEQPGWIGAGIFDPSRDGWITAWDRFELLDLFGGELGVREMIEEIGGHPGIEYIFLQSPGGVIFSSGDLEPVLKIKDDPFLETLIDSNWAETREIVYAGQPVLEAAQPFLHPRVQGVFRVGLRLETAATARTELTRQMLISGVFLVLLSAALAGYFAMRQGLAELGTSYKRIHTLAGQMLDSMDQGVIAIDRERRITVFNPAAERMFSRPSTDTVGSPYNRLFSSDECLLGEALDSGTTVVEKPWTYRSETGVRRLVVSATPIHEPDAERALISTSHRAGTARTPLGSMAVIRDETEARELEQQVRHAERLTEMGTLAAGVAHEIRNPLNAIALAAQRLRAEFEVVHDSAEFQKIASTVLGETQRLNGIVEGFLSLARRSGQEPEQVDLVPLLRSTVEMAAMEAEAEGIDVVFDPPAQVEVRVVADEIKKAVWNVIHNALAASTTGDRIAIGLRRSAEEIVLTVSDSGKGMSAEELDRAFRPYFTTKSGGTGLGLAITHRIVTDHHGRIAMTSEAGRGTEVTITLPLD